MKRFTYEMRDRAHAKVAEAAAWCLMLFFGLLLCAVAAGCQTPVAANPKTMAGLQHAKDAVMTQWGRYVAREQKRADALPDGQREAAHGALLAKRLKVDDALRQFSAAWAKAFTDAIYKTDAPPPADVATLFSNLELATQ